MTIKLKLPASWKTTLFGILGAVAVYVYGHPSEFPQWMQTVANLFAAGAFAGLGLTAKDSNVTGGSKANTSNNPTVVAETAAAVAPQK